MRNLNESLLLQQFYSNISDERGKTVLEEIDNILKIIPDIREEMFRESSILIVNKCDKDIDYESLVDEL